MIYLASPYSHSEPSIREARYHAVVDFASHHLNKGKVIFSPIAYGHPFAALKDHGTAHIDWIVFNEGMMDAASEMWVLRLGGWEASVGIKAEMAYMEAQGKTIHMVDPLDGRVGEMLP